ncbi:MAG: glycosyltransferase family 4 protein, partial [Bdellovibrionaceae bacterium]|nr:glycosyltransferase family 4 protein [Pseudobdellovibrionaceae bacterium]
TNKEAALLRRTEAVPSFLMVGTIEPRKGHVQVLEAFETLWAANHQINLVIVGKQGWMVEDLIERLRSHPEKNKRLFWLDDASDGMLQSLYQKAACLIAASYGEGFGLPLVEGAANKLPIMARDIPVFREVAGDHAYYFTAQSSEELAEAVSDWLKLDSTGMAPAPEGITPLTWAQSASALAKFLCDDSERLPEHAKQIQQHGK